MIVDPALDPSGRHEACFTGSEIVDVRVEATIGVLFDICDLGALKRPSLVPVLALQPSDDLALRSVGIGEISRTRGSGFVHELNAIKAPSGDNAGLLPSGTMGLDSPVASPA